MAIERVREYFRQYHIEDRIREFEVSSATVELAAAALGCEGKRIAKSLSFMVDGRAILIIAAGDAKIDNPKYKAQFGTKAKMLTKDETEAMRCESQAVALWIVGSHSLHVGGVGFHELIGGCDYIVGKGEQHSVGFFRGELQQRGRGAACIFEYLVHRCFEVWGISGRGKDRFRLHKGNLRG